MRNYQLFGVQINMTFIAGPKYVLCDQNNDLSAHQTDEETKKKRRNLCFSLAIVLCVYSSVVQQIFLRL